MFVNFFYQLKEAGIPVSLHELLTLLESLDKEIVGYNTDDFYFLSRSIFVKHENQLDRFDKLFGHYFKGMEYIPDEIFKNIPDEWLRKNFTRNFSEEEKRMIEAMGGVDALWKRFEELLQEQKERHEGGNKWIGTGGTSPFGANGYNPEGYRVGQEKSRNRSAVKVWDKREFANLAEDVELDTRNLKLALKRLRTFTREGIADELDLDDTIDSTSRNAGYLDIKMVPSKRNRVKVLMLFDIGGSMDDHVETCEKLFSAAKHEFKHLEYYYFHNCIYESVWKDNRMRWSERIPTLELLHKYDRNYKVIFVGDAAMSPYELVSAGGSVEHYNDEPGLGWLNKFKEQYPYLSWINPNPTRSWNYFESTKILREFLEERMFPMTIEGLTKTMKSLKDKKVTYSLSDASPFG